MINMEKIKYSINRLVSSEESLNLCENIIKDINELCGVNLTIYYDYYFEKTIEYLNNDTFNNNIQKIIDYLKQYDNNSTHIDVLYTINNQCQTLYQLNDGLKKIYLSIFDRYNVLKNKQNELKKLQNALNKFNYIEDNWEILEESDPKKFIDKINKLDGHDKYSLFFEKMDIIQNKHNDFSYKFPFIVELSKGNRGDLLTCLVFLKPHKENPIYKDFCIELNNKYKNKK